MAETTTGERETTRPAARRPARSWWTAIGHASWRAGLVIALVLIVDQVTKRIVRARIVPGDSDSVFPGVSLENVRNHGVAFGFFGGGGAVVVVLVALALGALIAYFLRHPGRRLLWLPTGMLLGGAAGNLVDRVSDGAVTDFIKIPLWPTFNVADISITFGVLALLYVLEGSTGAPPPADASRDRWRRRRDRA